MSAAPDHSLLPAPSASQPHPLTGIIPGLETELAALDRAIGIYADLSLRGLGAGSYEEGQAMRRVAIRGYRKAIRDFALAVGRNRESALASRGV